MKKRLLSVLSVILTFLMLGSTFSFAANVAPVSSDKFTDVDAEAWYFKYVDWITGNNTDGRDQNGRLNNTPVVCMNGTSETTFEPQTNLTRAMFATILARYDKADVDDSKATIFQDVLVDQWYTGSIGWANEKEIVKGYGDGNFGTMDDISRQDLSLMIIRYIRYYEKTHNVKIKTHGGEWNGDITFTDEDQIRQDQETPQAIKDLVNYGILLGYPDGTVKPTQKITRAETAAIIYRLNWILPPSPSGGGGGGAMKQDYYQVTVTLDPPDTATDQTIELKTNEYKKADANGLTMDDIALELISGVNENDMALINAFDSALERVRSQSSVSGSYTVNIDDEGVITAVRNGKVVNLKEELDKEKQTYTDRMDEIKSKEVANITSSKWQTFVDACWVGNLFDFTDPYAPKLLEDGQAYYEVLSTAVNAAVDLHKDLKDSGYDFAAGVQNVAAWAEAQGIQFNGYTINEGTVTNPTDILNGTRVIGALNYEEGILVDLLAAETEHTILEATETMPDNSADLMKLINDRTSMDFSDHQGGFEAILDAVVSNGNLLGDYKVNVTATKVKK